MSPEDHDENRLFVDGVLREVAQPPLVIKEKIASRIKVISKLKPGEPTRTSPRCSSPRARPGGM